MWKNPYLILAISAVVTFFVWQFAIDKARRLDIAARANAAGF